MGCGRKRQKDDVVRITNFGQAFRGAFDFHCFDVGQEVRQERFPLAARQLLG